MCIFITITLKENSVPIYYLQMQIVQFMKLKKNMFIKIFIEIKVCLNLVIDHEIQSFLILLIKKVIGKVKDELKGKIISEFVALKSKKYS